MTKEVKQSKAYVLLSSLGTIVGMLVYVAFFALSLGPLGWLLTFNNEIIMPDGTTAPNPGGAFIFYALIGVLGIIWGIKYIPETKGVSLEKIEQHWRDGKKPGDL